MSLITRKRPTNKHRTEKLLPAAGVGADSILVYEMNLAPLNPEAIVGLRPRTPRQGAVDKWEVMEDVDSANLLVDGVPAVRGVEGRREVELAVAGEVRAALEPRALRAEGWLDGGVAPGIDVGIAGGLEDLAGIALRLGDRVPGLALVVGQRTGGVEEPVAGIADDRLDLGDLVVGEGQTRTNDVRMLGGRYDLRVRRALSSVVEAAVEVDGDTLGQNALGNIHLHIVLLVFYRAR